MKTICVISSMVAASRVGALASAFCLRRLGHDAIVLPTTLMGRHPGWGDPGGGAVPELQLKKMWAAVKAQNIKFDAVLTGYMGEDEHIGLAADIMKDIKVQNPNAYMLVDPVMGDNGRLYVPAARAEAICKTLLPLADIITPNVWELAYIEASSKMRTGNKLITSVEQGDKIGATYVNGKTSVHVSHEKFDSVPHGGGDALAGLFLAHILLGQDPVIAMQKSVASVFVMMQAANKFDAGELPLMRTQDAWIDAPPLPVERDIS